MCSGVSSYTQPAGHTASLHVCNLIYAASTYCIVSGQPPLTVSVTPDSRSMDCPENHTQTHNTEFHPQAMMTAALDPFRSFSAELHTIRWLKSSLYRAHGARFHPPAEGGPLAPSRDDVPLLDPCCGQLSAGA